MKFTPQIHTSNMDQRARFSILLQGESGSGKTHFMMTCPSPLVLVWDLNLATHHKFDGMPYVVVKSWAEMEDFWLDAIKQRRLTEVVQGFQRPDGTKPFGTYRVETLCLDTLTGLGNQIQMELSEGHAKLGSRDKWDEYYSRFHRLLDAAVGATSVDNAHPEREVYYVVAGIHEEPIYESQGESKRLIGYKPTIAGKMANSGQIYTNFSTHLFMETVETMQGTSKVSRHQMRTRSFGLRRVMSDKVAGTRWKELPETLPNTWPDLIKAWGM